MQLLEPRTVLSGASITNLAVTSGVGVGEEVTLTGTVEDVPSTDAFAIEVNWGDGMVKTFGYAAGTANFSETHTYSENSSGQAGGQYEVTASLLIGNGEVGSEFQVNTYTNDSQSGADVGTAADGSFVVVWRSRGQDGDGDGVYAQRYNAEGVALGSEFRVNTETGDDQGAPAVAVAADGQFVVTWRSLNQDGDRYGTYAQRYNADGDAVGSEFQVNTYTSLNQRNSAVAIAGDGQFVVVWESDGQDGDLNGIYAQRYNADGDAVGSEFQVNTYTSGNQELPAVAIAGDGRFVIVWESMGQDGDSDGIYARRYEANGNAVGSEFQVNTHTAEYQVSPSIGMADDGQFVIGWSSRDQDGDSWGVYAQQYDADGDAVGSEFQVNTYTSDSQYLCALEMASDGQFVAVWRSRGQDGDDHGVYARRYNHCGDAIGGEFQVNTYTDSSQSSPAAAILPNGGFVVSWNSFGQDSDSHGVFAQRYAAPPAVDTATANVTVHPASLANVTVTSGGAVADAVTLTGDIQHADANESYTLIVDWGDGTTEEFKYGPGTTDFSETHRYSEDSSTQTGGQYEVSVTLQVGTDRVSDEFLVNTQTLGDQTHPEIASADDGSYVLVWHGEGQSGDSDGIHAQRYDAEGNTVGIETQINTTATGNQERATVAMAGDGTFVVAWESDGEDGDADGIYAQRFDASGSPVGSQFQVNTHTSDNQSRPSIAMLSDGGFVVTWASEFQDGNSSGIFAQRYDANGNAAGSEFQVNTHTDASQSSPIIVAIDDGRFVIAWDSYGPEGNLSDVYAQRYDADGNAEGGQFLVNTHTTGQEFVSSIDANPNGGFAITWTSYDQDGSGGGVYAQRYDEDGNTVGGEFQANTYTAGYQGVSDIVFDADGGFVITWQSQNQDGSIYGYAVYAQRYDAQGNAVGDEFKVNTSLWLDQSLPVIEMTSKRAFIIAWASEGQDGQDEGIYTRRFEYSETLDSTTANTTVHTTELTNLAVTSGAAVGDVVMLTGDIEHPPTTEPMTLVVDWGDGTTSEYDYTAGTTTFSETHIYTDDSLDETNEEFTVSVELIIGDVGVRGESVVNTTTTGWQNQPAIAVADDGSYVVAWTGRQGQDGSGAGVFAQRFDALGNALGDEFQVNTYTEQEQERPAIALAADGSFVITWSSVGQVHGGFYNSEIYAQRFAANGSKIDGEFRVNSTTVETQQVPVIAMADDGRFVIAWQSEEVGEFGVWDVRAQLYDANGATVGNEFTANTTTVGSQLHPSAAMASDGEFVITWTDFSGVDGDARGVLGQRYNSDGTANGSEFTINTTTAGQQSNPFVGYAANGSFVAAWQSNDENGYAIFAQRFDADGSAVGGEITIKTSATVSQFPSDIEVSDDGSFVVTWYNYNQDGDSSGVYARRFDANSNPVDDEFQVNVTTEDIQETAVVGVGADGMLVFAWVDGALDASGHGIVSRRFVEYDSLTDSITVGINPPPTVQIDSVTSDASEGDEVTLSGQFLYTPSDRALTLTIDWGDGTTTTHNYAAGTTTFSETHTYAQDSTGQTGGEYDITTGLQLTLTSNADEFQVNTHTDDRQYSPAVAMASDGSYVMVWQSSWQDGSGYGIYAQRYDADGNTVGSEFLVNTLKNSHQHSPTIAMGTDGQFVIAWTNGSGDGSGSGIYAQRYDAEGNTVGSEFQVNTTTQSHQDSPTIAMGPDGGFIIVWDSDEQDGSETGVYAQRYDAEGNTVGSEFRVNTHTNNRQSEPVIAIGPDGEFVIAWHSEDQDGDGYGVYAQRFDAQGNTVGGEFRVNTTTEFSQVSPEIAMGSNGEFVIVWNSIGQDGDGYGVYAQRFDAEGNTLGGEFLVNTTTEANQDGLAIGMALDGQFVIAWGSNGQDGDGYGVYAQRYDAEGNPLGGEFQVNTHTSGHQTLPTVAMGADGRLVIAWSSNGQDGDDYGIYAQRFAPVTFTSGSVTVANVAPTASITSVTTGENGLVTLSGTLGDVGTEDALTLVVDWGDGTIETFNYDAGTTTFTETHNYSTTDDTFSYSVEVSVRDDSFGHTDFAISTDPAGTQEHASIGVASDGSYIVTWKGSTSDGDDEGIYAQRYGAFGTPIGSIFQVNQTTAASEYRPDVEFAPDGSFLVTWYGFGADGNHNGVMGRRYSADGTALGDEFIVNTHTAISQLNSRVGFDGEGRFVIVWESFNQDGHFLGVYGQRFAANGTRLGEEFQVNTETDNNQTQVVLAVADDGRFVVAWVSDEQDGDGSGIYAQRYDADGNTAGGEFQVNTTTAGWQDGTTLAIDAEGNFLIAWTSPGQDQSTNGIYGQRYSADGTPIGGEFLLHESSSVHEVHPTLSMRADGTFVLTYELRSAGEFLYSVYAQQHAADGSQIGDRFLVTDATSTTYGTSTIAQAGANRFIVAWGFDNSTTTETELHGRIYGDGLNADGVSDPVTANVVFKNNAPTLAATPDSTLEYQEGFTAVTLFDEIVITDVDDTELLQATVQITEGYASGRDVLAGSADGPKAPGGLISISFDETTGTLTLSGNASLADYIAALKTVTFYTAGGLEASTRTVTLTITDANAVGHTDGTQIATDTRSLSLTPQAINTVPFTGPAEQQWESALNDGAAGEPGPRMWDASRTYVDTQVGTIDGTTVVYTRDADTGVWYVSKLENGHFTPEVAWGTWSDGLESEDHWATITLGDFNGDGASDILGLANDGSLWVMTANSTRDGFEEVTKVGSLSDSETWLDLSAADIDGDGRDDILARSQRGGGWWSVLRNDANDGFDAPAWLQRWDASQTWVDVHAVDLNNDGKTDLIGRSLESGEWVAMLAKADGTGFKNEQVVAKWDSSHTYVDVMVQDVDGDGTVDLLARTKETGEWHVSTGLTNGRIFAVSAANTWASWDAAWQLKRPWIHTTFGDFNGDGKLDLVTQGDIGATWWMMLANDAGDGFDEAFTIDLFNPTEMWSHLTAVDVNGDVGTNSTPRMDLIGLASGRTGWWIAESDPTSTDAATISAHASNTAFDRDATFETIGRGDFNGDGRVDLLAQEVDTGAWWVMLGGDTDSGFLAPQKWTTLGAGWQLARTWNRAVIGDVNGDGKDDVLIDHDRNGLYLMVANETGNGFERERWVRNINSQMDELFLLDVNGDGRDDLASFNDETDQWYLALARTDSIGFETMTESEAWTNPAWENRVWENFQVGDVNGDGHEDIIGRSTAANGMFVMLGSETGFENEQWVGRFPRGEDLREVLVADVTGDGRDDIIAWSKSDGDWLVMASGDDANLFEAPTTWATWTGWRVQKPWDVFLTGDVNQDGKMDLYSQAENGGWWLMLSDGTSFESPRYIRHN